jgi:hypothetical protein
MLAVCAIICVQVDMCTSDMYGYMHPRQSVLGSQLKHALQENSVETKERFSFMVKRCQRWSLKIYSTAVAIILIGDWQLYVMIQ